MIRLIAVAAWLCVVTLAASYVAATWRSGSGPEAEAPKYFGGLDYVKTKMISVPIIADGAIQGYVIAQFVFTVEASLLRRMSIKPDVFLVDEAIRAIYSGHEFDFRQMRKQDLTELARMIANNVNGRFGARLVEEVLVQELNYLPKDQVRGRNGL